ncbi:MAG: type II toxin-antitoxin system VapC family toxin [Spirochaetaceae bacterium]|jgi:predicted nucleic acid-binding protein|nr:type II toxin-antitoxin system VapC family toxin [Spirochaetaceae bacterium]
MMNVLDSSAWVEYAADGQLADTFEPILLKTDELVVPSICFHEVYKRISREKDDEAADHVVYMMSQGKVVDLDSSIAIYSTKISQTWKLPIADSIIYAITLLYEAELWTTDHHFKDLPAVHYFEKSV